MSEMLSDTGSPRVAAPVQSHAAAAPATERGVNGELAAVEPKGTPLAEALEYQLAMARGLCVSCAHDAACRLPRNFGGPVFYCEEYELAALPAGTAPSRKPQTARPAQRDSVAAPLAGLCVNCDARDDCRLPRPEGGVWCCEEYR